MELFQRAHEVLRTSFCVSRGLEPQDAPLDNKEVGRLYAMGTTLIIPIKKRDPPEEEGVIAIIPSSSKALRTRVTRPDAIIPADMIRKFSADLIIIVVETKQLVEKVLTVFPTAEVHVMSKFMDHNVVKNVHVNEHTLSSLSETGRETVASLPKIFSDDPQVIWRGFKVGDVIRIDRPECYYYRVVVRAPRY